MKSLPIREFVLREKDGTLPSGAVTIDVRTGGEYGLSHLPHAVNIDVSQPSFMSAIERLDKGKPYYVYCASGGRSQVAGQMMRAVGFVDVTNLEGGMIAL